MTHSNPWSTSFVQLHQTNLRSNIAGWLSLAAASASLLAAPFLPPNVSPIIFLTAAGAGLGASSSFRTGTATARTLNDYADIQAQNLQTSFYQDTVPGEALSDGAPVTERRNSENPVGISVRSNEPTLFNWSDFETNRNEYPHLAIVAGTGAGKSVLGEWLTTLLGGRTIVVAPHWQNGDYSSADLIIGAGRNYGTSAEEYGEIEDRKGNIIVVGETTITHPTESVTVCQFLRWLANEMDRRFKLDENGYRVGGEPLNVVLDEVPSYSGLPGYKDVMRVLIREARKVNIRLILMLQGSEVAAYGVSGEGQLRENLTTIRLGKFALNEAAVRARNSSKFEAVYWEKVLMMLENQERPAMVEDTPASVPVLKTVEEETPQDTPAPALDEGAKERLCSIILNLYDMRKEPLRPSDIGRYCRAAKGVKSSLIAGLFNELEAAERGTVDERGRFTAACSPVPSSGIVS